MLHHIITRSKTFYYCSQILFHVGFGFDFCNDSSQKLVIVQSAHMVEEYPFSLVLHPCAILKPGLAAIISGRERETRDDPLYSLTRVWRILDMDHKHSQIHADCHFKCERRPGTIDKKASLQNQPHHLGLCLFPLADSQLKGFSSVAVGLARITRGKISYLH